jgi:hypothetical protein
LTWFSTAFLPADFFPVVFFSAVLDAAFGGALALETDFAVFLGATAFLTAGFFDTGFFDAGLFADAVFFAAARLAALTFPAGTFFTGFFLPSDAFLFGVAFPLFFAAFFTAEDFAALGRFAVLTDFLALIAAGLAFFAAGLADGFALADLANLVLEVVFFATLKRSVSGCLSHLRHTSRKLNLKYPNLRSHLSSYKTVQPLNFIKIRVGTTIQVTRERRITLQF